MLARAGAAALIFESDTMRSRKSVSFRPEFQPVEERCLATVHPLVSHIGLHGLSGQATRPPSTPSAPGTRSIWPEEEVLARVNFHRAIGTGA